MAAMAPLAANNAHSQDAGLEIPSVVVIKNVHVWDGTAETTRDVDVLVVGDKIRKVAADIPTAGRYEVDAVRRSVERVADAPGLEGRNIQLAITGEDRRTEQVTVKVGVIDGKGGLSDPRADRLTPAHHAVEGNQPPGHHEQPTALHACVQTRYRRAGSCWWWASPPFATPEDLRLSWGVRSTPGIVDGPRIYSCGAIVSCTSGHGDWGGHTPHQAQGLSRQWGLVDVGYGADDSGGRDRGSARGNPFRDRERGAPRSRLWPVVVSLRWRIR